MCLYEFHGCLHCLPHSVASKCGCLVHRAMRRSSVAVELSRMRRPAEHWRRGACPQRPKRLVPHLKHQSRLSRSGRARHRCRPAGLPVQASMPRQVREDDSLFSTLKCVTWRCGRTLDKQLKHDIIFSPCLCLHERFCRASMSRQGIQCALAESDLHAHLGHPIVGCVMC